MKDAGADFEVMGLITISLSLLCTSQAQPKGKFKPLIDVLLAINLVILTSISEFGGGMFSLCTRP